MYAHVICPRIRGPVHEGPHPLSLSLSLALALALNEPHSRCYPIAGLCNRPSSPLVYTRQSADSLHSREKGLTRLGLTRKLQMGQYCAVAIGKRIVIWDFSTSQTFLRARILRCLTYTEMLSPFKIVTLQFLPF
jgi:hypothetical protein